MDFPGRTVEASLATLPTELADSIYESLPASTLTRLALVSKKLYAAVQGPLYRRPVLESFYKLQLFTRTLNGAAHWSKWGASASKNVLKLKVVVDPADYEERTRGKLTAVILARFCGTCARYNPYVEMHLSVINACCFEQPFVSFGGENFPRVTSLYLRLGYAGTLGHQSSPSGSGNTVLPSRRHMTLQARQQSTRSCQPNSKFWINVFNGNSFPDLEEVHFNHVPGSEYYLERSNVTFNPDDLAGLKNVRKIIVDSCPELNDLVIQNGLAGAPVLTSLALINCHVTYDTLAALLAHALPNLSEFKLQVPFESRFARQARDELGRRTGFENSQVPHLCPLIRKFSKNIKRLSLALPYLCRDMFIDEAENEALMKLGVPGTAVGGRYGDASQGELDTILLEKTLKDFRKNVEERAAAAKKSKRSKNRKADSDKEDYEADLKARERRRMILKEGWKRKILLMRRHCRDGDLWVELEYLATLEEPGIKWILGNYRLNEAGRFENGVLAKQLNLATEFKDELSPFTTRDQRAVLRRRAQNYVVDMNDHQDGVHHGMNQHPVGHIADEFAADLGGIHMPLNDNIEHDMLHGPVGQGFPPIPPVFGSDDEDDDDMAEDGQEQLANADHFEW